ncbi:hypothetical protein KQ41_07045 [Lysinibacillus fusiformis]|uniref:hypothetical protein n=1 Tax=Lysinibacillus fusiformis TaxID=28031 RepID=UPI000506621F|nr:hypothetical protein [Lysinibacillus fusiformis]KGA83786.1 hypothetical protein KQ41_07045 [Lysinibacillus fusiformis]
MKLGNFVLLFVAIFFVFMISQQIRFDEVKNVNDQKKTFDTYLTTASQDAITTLSNNANPSFEHYYLSDKYSAVNKEESYNAFVRTLNRNFEIHDKISEDVIAQHIPLFAILEYDGLSINKFQVYKKSGLTYSKRIWMPKIPFTYTDASGNIFRFTLDDYIQVYDQYNDEWFEGFVDEVAKEANVLLLKDKKKLEIIRKRTIVETLQSHFAEVIAEHNKFAMKQGITYTFALPVIDDETWYNSIDDIGIYTFFQGYPYFKIDKMYNHYAFVGARIKKNERIIGSTQDGRKIFYEENCNFSYPKEEVFSTKAEAAKAGYSEKSCLNR